MIEKARNVLLLTLVLAASWLGLVAGTLMTNRLCLDVIAQASPKVEPDGDATSGASQKQRYKNLELFQKVLRFVESNYVDPLKHEDLIHGAIKGMMGTLDPHSNFLPKEIFKDMKIDTSGKFGGLGIEIGVVDNVLTIIAPIEDTPAWKAGLKPKDRIVKISGDSTKGMSLVEAVSKMRGKRGSPVTITIFRKGFDKVKDVKITRAVIRIKAVKYEIIENGYGYIRLSTFSETAAKDVENAIKSMEKKHKLNGLVLDMRNTPGGLLDQAIDVTSLFLDEGVVVSTVGRDQDKKEVKHARKGKARKDFPVAVLVNSSTASAAEIVAGALQDHKRGVIMGQPTFGKGSVQTVIELGSETGLKLTIARYFTPNGKSIQGKGLDPDLLLDDYDSKLLEKAKITRDGLREKDLPGHLEGIEIEDYSKAELRAMSDGKSAGKESDNDEDMAPIRFNPKEDYQVKEAVNYLKSYKIFKNLSS